MTHMTPTGIADEPVDDPERFDIDSALGELFALKSGVTYALDMDGNLFDPNDIPVIGYAQKIKAAKDQGARPAHHSLLKLTSIRTPLCANDLQDVSWAVRWAMPWGPRSNS